MERTLEIVRKEFNEKRSLYVAAKKLNNVDPIIKTEFYKLKRELRSIPEIKVNVRRSWQRGNKKKSIRNKIFIKRIDPFSFCGLKNTAGPVEGNSHQTKRPIRNLPMNGSNIVAFAMKGLRQKVLNELTEDDIQAMLPRDMFRLVSHEALRMRNLPLILECAKQWAPYEHPKLIAAQVDGSARRNASEFTDEELIALAGTGMGIEGIVEEGEFEETST